MRRVHKIHKRRHQNTQESVSKIHCNIITCILFNVPLVGFDKTNQWFILISAMDLAREQRAYEPGVGVSIALLHAHTTNITIIMPANTYNKLAHRSESS